MLTFEKIRWKNFLSTGNAFTEVELNKNASVLIVGKNGSGKSTILDALTFVLFGKPFRNINKPLLVNSINGKGTLVELEFKVGTTPYKIVRGLKPGVFEIYHNGKMLDQDSKVTDYQDFLEKNVIKMNFKSFIQIVVLGAASFVPFMQLSAADRRQIIEELLDIRIFSTMNVVAKQKLQTNREDFEKNKITLNMLLQKMEVVKSTIDKLSSSSKKREKEVNDEISELEKAILELKETIDRESELTDTWSDLKTTISSLNDKRFELVSVRSKLQHSLERVEMENTFFHDNETCRMCKQNLEHDFKEDMITKNNARILEYKDALKKLQSKYGEIQDKIEAKEQELHVTNHDIGLVQNYKTRTNGMQKQIKILQDSLTNTDTQVLADNRKILKNDKEKQKRLDEEKEQLLLDRQNLEIIISLLKDGGIKTRIIKQYLPIINKTVNKYLQQMEFYVNFNINESFEESIKSRHRDDFAYENFSEGEKMRIDLALLFAWRHIAKMKNSINTNLLILDEIFDSSLDGEGTDEFLKIMQGLTKDTNTFIISHKRDQLLDKFQKVIRFEKRNDFSKIVE